MEAAVQSAGVAATMIHSTLITSLVVVRDDSLRQGDTWNTLVQKRVNDFQGDLIVPQTVWVTVSVTPDSEDFKPASAPIVQPITPSPSVQGSVIQTLATSTRAPAALPQLVDGSSSFNPANPCPPKTDPIVLLFRIFSPLQYSQVSDFDLPDFNLPSFNKRFSNQHPVAPDTLIIRDQHTLLIFFIYFILFTFLVLLKPLNPLNLLNLPNLILHHPSHRRPRHQTHHHLPHAQRTHHRQNQNRHPPHPRPLRPRRRRHRRPIHRLRHLAQQRKAPQRASTSGYGSQGRQRQEGVSGGELCGGGGISAGGEGDGEEGEGGVWGGEGDVEEGV
ncbi:hypothetical protein GRF29_77g818838 [Pseudopithomyces chartarum]|uniref:Uncharacterized protein n=1 Tax=Pseudopithomyces chartarum TaxID=1892770 RepID=A0AAN6RHM3_9PLEO|nr:hypothetical protein GRF29_77g818838 [Pseudopithomyces chartarum]